MGEGRGSPLKFSDIHRVIKSHTTCTIDSRVEHVDLSLCISVNFGKTFGDYAHSCVCGPRSAGRAPMPERNVILRARRGRVGMWRFNDCRTFPPS